MPKRSIPSPYFNKGKKHVKFSPSSEKEKGTKSRPLEISDSLLGPDQIKVLNACKTGTNIFFMGEAGSGKSEILKKCIRWAIETYGQEKVGVTATTGIAAVAMGGCTINRYFGIGLGKDPIETIIKDIKKRRIQLSNWRNSKVLFIEEIGMLKNSIFSKLNEIGKRLRNSTAPFGGIQVVACGDFLQLPPIPDRDEDIKKIYCFLCPDWKEVFKESIYLSKIYRQQTDDLFREILTEIRHGKLSNEHEKILIDSRDGLRDDVVVGKTRLYSKREEAEKENQKFLDAINGQSITYTSTDVITPESSALANKWFFDACIAPSTLELKVGCRVLLITNMNQDIGLVNGLGGIVEKISGSCPMVKFDNGVCTTVVRQTWLNEEAGITLGWREQIPLILAWALTIHKAQGMTISNLQVDMDNMFACGMAYVALSRGVSLSNISILNMKRAKIFADPVALKFCDDLQNSN